MRHGCLLAIVLALGGQVAGAAPPPADERITVVTTRELQLNYAIDTPSMPLTSVELWYTLDQGATWRLFGRDADLAPPMAFHAPQRGLCGVYFVVRNAAGASGPPPSATSEPHLWLLIDEEAPVIQFHQPQLAPPVGSRLTVRLRWTMLEDHPVERPIDLAYRTVPDGSWCDLARDLPNSSAYDWLVPPEIRGSLEFRLTARDRAGHRTEAVSQALAVDISSNGPDGLRLDPPLPAHSQTLTAEELKRARELLRMGRRHQLHGKHDLAVARLRDALQIDPEMPEALVALGASLYALGQFEDSAQAFELALKYMPLDRDALEGLARTLVAMRKYTAAEARLLAIVEHQPQDVEAWLHLGDIAIYQGNEIMARDYYLKAATLVPEAVSVVSRARARLDDLPTLHRRFEQTETP